MNTLLALGLLVAAAVATPTYSGAGAGHNGGHNGGGYAAPSRFTQDELEELDGYLHKVANQKIALHGRAERVKEAAGDLLDKLDQIIEEKLPALSGGQDEQSERIARLFDGINEATRRTAAAGAAAAGAAATATAQAARIAPTQSDIDALEATNTNQDARLADAADFLRNAVTTAQRRIEDAEADFQEEITALTADTQDVADFVDTRKCYVEFVEVEINADGDNADQGSGYIYFPDGTFSGSDVPSVTCAIQGFVTKLNIGETQQASGHGGGYGGYGGGYGGYAQEDERQHLAVELNCEATNDGASVYAFDQSRGEGNAVTKLYVQVKACSLSAISGFTH